VSVSVASVTSYLPSSTEDNSAPFLGLSSGPQAVNNEYQGQLRTPIQEATLRAQQIDMQMKDADERNIVWGMEEGLCDQDPDGENGLDRVLCADGTFAPINVHDSGVDIILPIGIRNDKGGIEPIPSAGKETGEKNPENVGMNDYINVDLEVEALFGGVSETAPNHVAKLVSLTSSYFS
jgi:hypothetical protein